MVGVIGIDSMGQIGDFRGGLAGVKKIVVAYRRGKSFRYHSKHAYPAGAYFCSYKSRQNTLGALPQDPCRWLCWIRIDLRRVIYALSDFLIMILSWLVKQSLRAFLFQEVQP